MRTLNSFHRDRNAEDGEARRSCDAVLAFERQSHSTAIVVLVMTLPRLLGIKVTVC
jgi:hypothetical protein